MTQPSCALPIAWARALVLGLAARRGPPGARIKDVAELAARGRQSTLAVSGRRDAAVAHGDADHCALAIARVGDVVVVHAILVANTQHLATEVEGRSSGATTHVRSSTRCCTRRCKMTCCFSCITSDSQTCRERDGPSQPCPSLPGSDPKALAP